MSCFIFWGLFQNPMQRSSHKMEEESKTIRTPPIYLFIYLFLLYYLRAGDNQVPSPCDIFPS
jgi:hypothetical protein